MKNKITTLFLLTILSLSSTQAMFNDQNERNKEMDRANVQAARECGRAIEEAEKARLKAEEAQREQAEREENNRLHEQKMAKMTALYAEAAQKRAEDEKKYQEKRAEENKEFQRRMEMKKAKNAAEANK